MAIRKRSAPKGLKRGESGGANPRSAGRISEQQHDEAMRVLRAEYYQAVRDIVKEADRAIKDGEITNDEELNDWVHQTVDGSYWVIYTHANFQLLLVTDNHDAYSEDFGEAPVRDGNINWAALAYAAMERDVREQMDAEDIAVKETEEELEEAPRRRPSHKIPLRRPPHRRR